MTSILASPMAACRNSTVDFFPTSTTGAAACRKICKSCPINAACLREALAEPAEQQFGYRGGMAQDARRNWIRKRTGNLPKWYLEDARIRAAEAAEIAARTEQVAA